MRAGKALQRCEGRHGGGGTRQQRRQEFRLRCAIHAGPAPVLHQISSVSLPPREDVAGLTVGSAKPAERRYQPPRCANTPSSQAGGRLAAWRFLAAVGCHGGASAASHTRDGLAGQWRDRQAHFQAPGIMSRVASAGRHQAHSGPAPTASARPNASSIGCRGAIYAPALVLKPCSTDGDGQPSRPRVRPFSARTVRTAMSRLISDGGTGGFPCQGSRCLAHASRREQHACPDPSTPALIIVRRQEPGQSLLSVRKAPASPGSARWSRNTGNRESGTGFFAPRIIAPEWWRRAVASPAPPT